MRNQIHEEEKIQEVMSFIQRTAYGEVVVTIHDAKIVQIEKREKKRFAVQKRLHRQS